MASRWNTATPQTGETRGGRARLVDFDDPLANDLLVVRQLTVRGPSGKLIRLDLVVFLNGLPIAVIELKDPTDPQADLNAAIEQLDRYQDDGAGAFRAEPGAGGLRRDADAGRLHHQRTAAASCRGDRSRTTAAARRRWRR